MEKELKKAFQKNKTEDSFLSEAVWQKIIYRNKLITRIKLGVFSILGLSSLAGLIPAWSKLSTDLSQSGFYEYSSILFSVDIFKYGKELTLSIAETLPTTSIVLSLTLVFVVLLSIKYIIRQIIRNELFTNNFSALSIN